MSYLFASSHSVDPLCAPERKKSYSPLYFGQEEKISGQSIEKRALLFFTGRVGIG